MAGLRRALASCTRNATTARIVAAGRALASAVAGARPRLGPGALAALAALGSAFACAAGEPAARPPGRSVVIIQSSPLAGFQFHAGRALWNELRAGDPLTLVREPANPHDPNAVRVDWRGIKLGYVPRRENAQLARQMDLGAPLEARIVRLTESRNPWRRIEFEVVLVLPERPAAREAPAAPAAQPEP